MAPIFCHGRIFQVTGFCCSVALISHFQLQHKAIHVNRFQDQLSGIDGIVPERLHAYAGLLDSKGVSPDIAEKIARGLLGKSIESQAALRTIMDYYLFISILLAIVITIIILFPYLNRTKINLLASKPAPAGF